MEQRKILIRAPSDKGRVVKTLAALMAWPEGLFEASGSYIGVRLAASRLHQAKGTTGDQGSRRSPLGDCDQCRGRRAR